ncbi:MAG: hypothetical protein ABII07_01645 [Patescibacteria group bacterium]|nr:hypothetical protein [Patescibacteria group bacterium]
MILDEICYNHAVKKIFITFSVLIAVLIGLTLVGLPYYKMYSGIMEKCLVFPSELGEGAQIVYQESGGSFRECVHPFYDSGSWNWDGNSLTSDNGSIAISSSKIQKWSSDDELEWEVDMNSESGKRFLNTSVVELENFVYFAIGKEVDSDRLYLWWLDEDGNFIEENFVEVVEKDGIYTLRSDENYIFAHEDNAYVYPSCAREMDLLHVSSRGEVLGDYEIVSTGSTSNCIKDIYALEDDSLIILSEFNENTVVTRLSSDGEVFWEKTIEGKSFEEYTFSCLAREIYEKENGDLFMIGESYNYYLDSRGMDYDYSWGSVCTFLMDPGTGEYSDPQEYKDVVSGSTFIKAIQVSLDDYVVLSNAHGYPSSVSLTKIDSQGDLIWQKVYSSFWKEKGFQLAPAGNNNLYVFGTKQIGDSDYSRSNTLAFQMLVNQDGDIYPIGNLKRKLIGVWDRIEYFITLRWLFFG